MDRLLARPGQYLSDHLRQVAVKAKTFACYFGAEEFGNITGLLHDLGKAEDHFQQRVGTGDSDTKAPKKPHCHHGAAYLLNREPVQWPAAIAINGHHAGLHNRGNVDQRREKYKIPACECEARLKSDSPDFGISLPPMILPDWLKHLEYLPNYRGEGWLATDLFTRFLFSALIDADRLDSEESEKGHDTSLKARTWKAFDPQILLGKLEEVLKKRAKDAIEQGKSSGSVQSVREEVGHFCRDSAKQDRGLFSLMVPTGGGKTFASMLFALHHAVYHNEKAPDYNRIRRIIVVIPYLSIIQQTVKEYREVFETDTEYKNQLILEHHSQIEDEPDPKEREKNDGKYNEISERRKLAAENWDAPLIVTTSVQFFESLFSRRPSKARKLHNIAQSMVIFDKVQTLPPLMMQPILNVIDELANQARPYGCSFVFCTATQPSLEYSEQNLLVGFKNVRPIIPPEKAKKHFKSLERVKYEWPEKDESMTWDELSDTILSHDIPQALVIVNTRKAARELHNAIKEKLGSNDDGLFHLSTWMMPSHRNEVLEEVRNCLKDYRRRCILVSTQCIEAGVDVDFPLVWRAFGPYDSIVQAAGRCNRNGLMDQDKAVVRIFYPKDGKTPPGLYNTAISQTQVLRKMNLAEPNDPESFPAYFRLLYQLSVPDECGVQRARSRLQFEEVDRVFQFIEDNTFSVLIQYESINGQERPTEAKSIYDAACSRANSKTENGYFTREEWRKIQPFILHVSKHIDSEKKEEIKWKMRPAFDQESGLFIWEGVYDGGLAGVGIDFDGPIPAERMVL